MITFSEQPKRLTQNFFLFSGQEAKGNPKGFSILQKGGTEKTPTTETEKRLNRDQSHTWWRDHRNVSLVS